MMGDQFDICVKARMYHGLLKRIVEENGGVQKLSSEIGIHPTTLYLWLRMDGSPINQSHGISPRNLNAIKILCRLGKCQVTDLWPTWFDELAPLKKTIEFHRSVEPRMLTNKSNMLALPYRDQTEQQAINKELVDKMLAPLRARTREILRMRMAGSKYDDVAKVFGITIERARQIEQKAWRQIKGLAERNGPGKEFIAEEKEMEEIKKRWSELDEKANCLDTGGRES